MNVTARDVMTPRFHTLAPEMPISEAVKRFKQATEAEGRKIFGMLVTDGSGRMLGMLSMYDILLFIQPKHVHIWGPMDDVDIVGLVDNACHRAGTILVGDIMTTDVISITPETPPHGGSRHHDQKAHPPDTGGQRRQDRGHRLYIRPVLSSRRQNDVAGGGMTGIAQKNTFLSVFHVELLM